MKSSTELFKLIKRIINEEVNNTFKFKIIGNLNKLPGIKIQFLNHKNEEIGICSLLDFDNSHILSPDFRMFNNRRHNNIIFNGDNCLYLYGLKVNDAFKGKGYSKKLMNKIKEIGKNNGYDYITLIVDCDNMVAQNLYKKLGYQLHQTKDNQDFYYLDLYK